MEQQREENKLGTLPISKLLATLSVPIMCSMLVQALYNIVDSIFVARFDPDALVAVSLAMPYQTIIIAVSSGIGIGMGSLLSRKLGEKNYKAANDSARHGIFLIGIAAVIFLILGIFLTRRYFLIQTTDERVIEFGVDYLSIVSICAFAPLTHMMMERLLQATGKSMMSMISQLIGAVTNIILDPIMIFGLFGFPRLGVAGAAIATVIGQSLGALSAFLFNIKKNTDINISMKGFKPQMSVIRIILSVGVPSMVMQAIGSFLTFMLNGILLAFSKTAASVLGIYFKLQSFIFMPIFGLNAGLIPIVAYNFGARKKKRITSAIRLGIIYACGLMVIGLIAFQFFPETLMRIFMDDEEALSIGVPALRRISLSFTFAGYCIICGTVFQAFGKGLLSLVTAIIRQLIFLLPAAWLLASTGNVDNVWYAFPIAEISSAVMTTIFLLRVYKTVINPIEDETAPSPTPALAEISGK